MPPQPMSMREIRLPNVPKAVNILYSSGICANFTNREFLSLPRHSRKIKIEHNLEKRSDDRLYWSFISQTSASKLSMHCVRAHYRRKWNDAFIKALKSNGLDSRGQKLPSMAGVTKEIGIIGTLEVRLYGAPCWENENQWKMAEYSDNIVKGLLRIQSRGP